MLFKKYKNASLYLSPSCKVNQKISHLSQLTLINTIYLNPKALLLKKPMITIDFYTLL